MHADTITVRLTPAIALDYASRNAFPGVRLKERPGRVPIACNLQISRELAEAMLADSRVRPAQLKVKLGNFKGGAVVVWDKLTAELEFALLSPREQARIQQAQAQGRRWSGWSNAALSVEAGYRDGPLHKFWQLSLKEKHVAHNTFLRDPGMRAMRYLLEKFDELMEAAIEERMGSEQWLAAGTELSRIARSDLLAVDWDVPVTKTASR